MPDQPYDPNGALNGLFAPAYIHGNPQSEAAVAAWQAANHAVTPDMIEATRGPAHTVTNSGLGGLGVRSGGSSTSTIPGSVDPEILRIYAQGGHYTPTAGGSGGGGGSGATDPNAQRDAIAQSLMGRGGMSLIPNPDPNSPLRYLMGSGDNTGFMQGSFPGGA